MRIRVPRTTALIFSSGKMVCTGAKSENEVIFNLLSNNQNRNFFEMGLDWMGPNQKLTQISLFYQNETESKCKQKQYVFIDSVTI